MLKKAIYSLLIFLCMIPLIVLAASDPASLIVADSSGQEIAVSLDTLLPDIPDTFVNTFTSGQLPLWRTPGATTENNTGFISTASIKGYKYKKNTIKQITLYCAYDYDKEGFSAEQNQARLSTIQLSLSNTDDQSFKSLISTHTKVYGSPKTTEEQIGQGIMMVSSGIYKYNIYERTYTWRCPNRTGIIIKGSYNTASRSYSDISVLISKTDMDTTLQNGKIPDMPSAVEVTTKADSVLMRDEKGDLLRDMKRGETLLVTAYDADQDKFIAELISRGLEGYISGKGLDISKDELIEHFQ